MAVGTDASATLTAFPSCYTRARPEALGLGRAVPDAPTSMRIAPFAAKRLTRNAAQQPIKQQNEQNKHCINFQIFGSKKLVAMQQFCCIAFAPRRSSASRSTMLLLFNDDGARQCPLLGVKRTLLGHCGMSVFDPKRTFGQWQLWTIKTAKPPAVRGQRLCLRPPYGAVDPRHGAMGYRTGGRARHPVRQGKHTAGRYRGSVGNLTPKAGSPHQTS